MSQMKLTHTLCGATGVITLYHMYYSIRHSTADVQMLYMREKKAKSRWDLWMLALLWKYEEQGSQKSRSPGSRDKLD